MNGFADECGAAGPVHWKAGWRDILPKVDDDAQTPPEEYRAVLKRIIRRIRAVFPKARMPFALTTQVRKEYMLNPDFYCRSREIEQYTGIARELMAAEHIAVDDLYTISAQRPREWHSLAEQVATLLRAQL